MYAIWTKRKLSAPRATSVGVRALKLVLAAVIAAAIHYDCGRSVRGPTLQF
jgi:hypothetical protein